MKNTTNCPRWCLLLIFMAVHLGVAACGEEDSPKPAYGWCAGDEDCSDSKVCSGSQCVLSNACEGIPCSDRGRCALVGGEPTCACENGYRPEGLNCLAENGFEGTGGQGGAGGQGEDGEQGGNGGDLESNPDADACGSLNRDDRCEVCACDRCIQQVETCFRDPNCDAIVTCARQTGCDGVACIFECGDQIEAARGIGSPSVANALALSNCRDAHCLRECL